MRTELKEFIMSILHAQGFDDSEMPAVAALLNDTWWFGVPPIKENGKLYLDYEMQDTYRHKICNFLKRNSLNSRLELFNALHEKFPVTAGQFKEFCDEASVPEDAAVYIVDFFLCRLHSDLFLIDDIEAEKLVRDAAIDLTKSHGEQLTFFMAWIKSRCKTKYKNEYIMEKRYTVTYGKEAYDIDDYLQLLLYLYSEDYIEENDMYVRATDSKNYADTWLYLSMHFICSLRMTDLERIGHPELEEEPEIILKKIRNNEMTDNEARKILLYVNYRFCLLNLTPNKTSDRANVPSIKLHIPNNCEVHIGKLFAICEAHRRMAGIPDKEPLIRRIADYDRINRYMGEDIGNLFLYRNFHARSANKSYLQAIYTLSDEILEESEGFRAKGYILASMARSHKGSFGDFAETTAIYLRDANFSGLTPEFVAYELLERGVLSFIPTMLLKMITEGKYNSLSVKEQTKLIQALDMSPREVEHTVALCSTARKRSEKIIHEIVKSGMSTKSILQILHHIGSGEAFSKRPEFLCLVTATGKTCPYSKNCVSCEYEISTKSTFFLLISEYNRLSALFNEANEELEKNKYRKLITETIIPRFDEILTCIRDSYGDKAFDDYESMLREYIQ